MNVKLIVLIIFGSILAVLSFLSDYKQLFLYVFAFMFFIAVTIKVVKNIASRKAMANN